VGLYSVFTDLLVLLEGDFHHGTIFGKGEVVVACEWGVGHADDAFAVGVDDFVGRAEVEPAMGRAFVLGAVHVFFIFEFEESYVIGYGFGIFGACFEEFVPFYDGLCSLGENF